MDRSSRRKTFEEAFNDPALLQRAMQGAVREALREHQRRGLPVAEWRDGKVVWVPAEEIAASPEAD